MLTHFRMPTNFNEKICPFFICSPNVGQNQQLRPTDDKIYAKVAQSSRRYLKKPKNSKSPKPNFRVPTAGKSSPICTFRHEFLLYALAYV